MKKTKHFIDLQNMEVKEIYNLLELMTILKKARYENAIPLLLKGRTLATIWEQQSTRTRVSFETAMTLLGGHSQFLGPGSIWLGKKESLYDTAKVLSRMVDGIMIRAASHEMVESFAKYSDVPVFNALTDYNHPTQALCDVFTMIEHQKKLYGDKFDFRKITVVFVGDSTNVCSSTMHIVTQLGGNFIHISPKKYQSPQKWIDIANENIKKSKSGSVIVTDDIKMIEKADVVYTDLWWWFGQESEIDDRLKAFKTKYQVNEKMMAKTKDSCVFMHCLPAIRELEATNQVMDSKKSIIYHQAENRLTAQLALLVYFIYPNTPVRSKKKISSYKKQIDALVSGEHENYEKTWTYGNDYKFPIDIDEIIKKPKDN